MSLKLNLGNVPPPLISPSTPRRNSGSLLRKLLNSSPSSSSSNKSSTPSSLEEVMDFKNYTILNVILSTGNSTIYRVLVNNLLLCMKKIDLSNTNIATSKSFFKERDLYENIPYHNNIVGYIGNFYDEKELCLFMTPYDMSVFDFINLRKPLNAYECEKIIKDVALGILHLHKNHIIHRDIKPDNIMLFLDNDYNIIRASIGDLDNAAFIKFDLSNQIVGTPGYTAPEVLNEEYYDYSIDIYSLGITIYHMITGNFPYWDKRNVHEIHEAVINGERPTFVNTSLDNSFGTLRNIFHRATEYNSKDRISLNDIIKLL